MNLKFLKQLNINEADESDMDTAEMKSYLSVMRKKCTSDDIRSEFDDKLKSLCDGETDLTKCSKTLCDKKSYTSELKSLETISNKVNENSLSHIIESEYLGSGEDAYDDLDCGDSDREFTDGEIEYCKKKFIKKYFNDFSIANN